jgi:dihydrofolate reductase
LDGYIAREDGSVDWLPESAESGYDAFYKSIDAVIMGKTTYDQILTFGEYPYKEKKSFVFTSNATKSKDKNTVFLSDVEKFVKSSLSDAGENIWLVGGAQIITSFLKLKAVDEIITTIIPVLLDKGIPLFQNIEYDVKLELIKTTKYTQLVDLHYKVLN